MEVLENERNRIQIKEARTKLSSKIRALEQDIAKWSRIIQRSSSETMYERYLEKEEGEPNFLERMHDELSSLKKALEDLEDQK